MRIENYGNRTYIDNNIIQKNSRKPHRGQNVIAKRSMFRRSGERSRRIEFSMAVVKAEKGYQGLCRTHRLYQVEWTYQECCGIFVRFERDLEGGGRGIACEPPLPVDQYHPARMKGT